MYTLFPAFSPAASTTIHPPTAVRDCVGKKEKEGEDDVRWSSERVRKEEEEKNLNVSLSPNAKGVQDQPTEQEEVDLFDSVQVSEQVLNLVDN